VRETLKLATKTVADAMTPLPAVRMLSSEDTIFDENTMVGLSVQVEVSLSIALKRLVSNSWTINL
jgi:hypothetical protein